MEDPEWARQDWIGEDEVSDLSNLLLLPVAFSSLLLPRKEPREGASWCVIKARVKD